MDAEWATCKAAKKLAKFGGGPFCGLLEVEGKGPLHIFNGFVMTMRSKPTKPSTEIYHYSVEWEPSKLSWSTLAAGSSGLPTLPSPRRTLCEA